jgi:protein required for attachment to host cells
MAENWIVVANNAMARIFATALPAPRLKDPETAEAGSRLVELETLEHPEGRLKALSMDADRPGRSFESAGMKRHAVTREIDPKKQEAIAFARQVAGRLESARLHGEVERILLVAAPAFLGLLRSSLDEETGRLVEREFNLDLAGMTPDEIRKHLPEKLFSAA